MTISSAQAASFLQYHLESEVSTGFTSFTPAETTALPDFTSIGPAQQAADVVCIAFVHLAPAPNLTISADWTCYENYPNPNFAACKQ